MTILRLRFSITNGVDSERRSNPSFVMPVMGYSADGLPYVGAVPGRLNQFIVAGFTGHGMPQAFLCAKGIASVVLQGVDFEATGIPKVFEVTEERLNDTRNLAIEAWEAAQRSSETT